LTAPVCLSNRSPLASFGAQPKRPLNARLNDKSLGLIGDNEPGELDDDPLAACDLSLSAQMERGTFPAWKLSSRLFEWSSMSAIANCGRQTANRRQCVDEIPEVLAKISNINGYK
jgi:hypothetical protein